MKDKLIEDLETLKQTMLALRGELIAQRTSLDPQRRAKATATLRSVARLADSTAKEIAR